MNSTGIIYNEDNDRAILLITLTMDQSSSQDLTTELLERLDGLEVNSVNLLIEVKDASGLRLTKKLFEQIREELELLDTLNRCALLAESSLVSELEELTDNFLPTVAVRSYLIKNIEIANDWVRIY